MYDRDFPGRPDSYTRGELAVAGLGAVGLLVAALLLLALLGVWASSR